MWCDVVMPGDQELTLPSPSYPHSSLPTALLYSCALFGVRFVIFSPSPPRAVSQKLSGAPFAAAAQTPGTAA